jgi:colanic acid/amylovoran biosynthesis glycosyltransferase
MNRAWLLRYFPTVSETFVYDELLELDRMGVTPGLWAADRVDVPLHAGLDELSGRCRYVPRAHHPSVLGRAPAAMTSPLASVWTRWGGRAKDLRRALWFASALDDDGVRHLHVHFAAEMAEWAWVVNRTVGIPYSVTVHARDLYCPRPSLDDVLAGAARLITISEYNARHLRQRGVADERIAVVRQGIPLPADPGPRPPRADRPLRVLSVGRLVPKKGHDLLVEAAATMKTRGVDLDVDVVGDGPLAAQLAGLAGSLDAPVTWHGALPREQVMTLLDAADLFVLPCRVDADGDRDGIPVALMEAMARRVPVVSTHVSGIPELIEDGVQGVLVPVDDAPALASAIGRLESDAALCRRLGAAARTTVEAEHDLSRQVQRLLEVLKTA